MLRVLDLFSGTRSATRSFASNGHSVEYVEILDGIDISTYHPSHEFDYAWASPPCVEYSFLNSKFATWKSKYQTDDSLWLHALRVIKEAKPRFWIIENVKGAQRRWGRAPYHYGSYFLWGYFPEIKASIPWSTSLKGTHCDRSKSTGRNWAGEQTDDGKTAVQKAMIPPELERAVYAAITKGLR